MVAAIQSDLRETQPSLHLHIRQTARAVIRGTYVVWSDEGKELDRYQVAIYLPGRYPNKLPIVKEVGGRIPRIPDRHINHDGTACVLVPEDRGRCFPPGARFSEYLSGPLHDFFLGQTYYEREGKWPFDHWSHGVKGILEYYQALTGVTGEYTVINFVRVLSYPKLKKSLLCPCGSNKRLQWCCYDKIVHLREIIDQVVPQRSLKMLVAMKRHYSR